MKLTAQLARIDLCTHCLTNGNEDSIFGDSTCECGMEQNHLHCPECGKVQKWNDVQPPARFPIVETPDGLQYTFPADRDEFQPRLF